jgi:anti-sigma factor RsiW
MNKPCAYYRRLISRRIDGDLSPEENGHLQRHLSLCASCRRAQANYRQLSENLQNVLTAAQENSTTSRKTAVLPRRRSRTVRRPLALAAAAMVLVIGGLWLSRFLPPNNARPNTTASRPTAKNLDTSAWTTYRYYRQKKAPSDDYDESLLAAFRTYQDFTAPADANR